MVLLTWRERLAQEPRLADMAQWPVIALDTVPRERRRTFLRNQRAVAQVLAGHTLARAAQDQHLSRARVQQLLARCLGGEPAGAPALTAALIPHRRLGEAQRGAPLPRLAQPGGARCAFRALLDTVPGLRETFDAMILAKLKDTAYAQQLVPRAFHKALLRILAEQHWPADQYPYSHASRAYQSVRRYLRSRTAALQRERQASRRAVAWRPQASAKPFRALRAVEIDEHILDLQGRVHLLLDGHLIPLRLARAALLVAIDIDLHCVLGYHLALTHHPNQQDLLTLFDNCLRPWQLPTLATEGLAYSPEACFPSGLPGGFPISFGAVHLDNALIHQARTVSDFLCVRCGASLHFGHPNMPEVRQCVESVFDYINTHCSHRVASTSGSHPTDPAKESRKNRKTPPWITFQTLNEALSVLLTDLNVTPQPVLGSGSPLEVYRHELANHFVRFVPPALAQQWQPLVSSVTLPLHWYRHEHRLPHVNFLYERYKGPGLLRVADTARAVRATFDRRDIRVLHAYTLDGEALGEVYVSRPWQRYPHSVATRQHIHMLDKVARFNQRDPMGDYFRYLLDRRAKPEAALSLLRVYTEFTAGQAGELTLDATALSHPRSDHADSPFRWTPATANHLE